MCKYCYIEYVFDFKNYSNAKIICSNINCDKKSYKKRNCWKKEDGKYVFNVNIVKEKKKNKHIDFFKTYIDFVNIVEYSDFFSVEIFVNLITIFMCVINTLNS